MEPRPALWLGIIDIVFVLGVVITIIFLGLGLFQQPPGPVLTDAVNANFTGPWSMWAPAPGVRCLSYPAFSTGTPTSPATTGLALSCTPLNMVSAIQTQRKCLKAGCLDTQGVSQPVGYVESLYQDCGVGFGCQLGTTGCFAVIPGCEDIGYSLARITTGGACLIAAGTTGPGAIQIGACNTSRPQQFNFAALPKTTFGQPYQIVEPVSGLCLGINNTILPSPLVLGGCSTKSGWYITPQAVTQVPLPGNTGGFVTATVPSQLLWVPDLAAGPSTFPTTYSGLQTIAQFLDSIQGAVVKPFIPACSNTPTPLSLPTCPVNAVIPYALLA